jgi:SAM-dependent methyltransferase
MFFPDKQKAYREALRVLKPGGRFFFNVWDRIDSNDLTLIVHRTLEELYPDDPPGFLVRTPRLSRHRYNPRRPRRRRLHREHGGHAKIALPRALARHAALGLIQGSPLGGEIAARDATALDRVVEAATRAITERFGPGPIEASMQAHVFSATAHPADGG